MREVVALGAGASSNCDLVAQAKISVSVILIISDKSNKILFWLMCYHSAVLIYLTG